MTKLLLVFMLAAPASAQVVTISNPPASGGAIAPTSISASTITTAGLTVNAPNASSTATIVNAASASTADILDIQVAGTNATRFGGKIGGPQYPQRTITQIDALVPDFIGQHVTATNMTSTIFFPAGVSDCISTGTAIAQWAVVGGTHGVRMNGCGSGQ